MLKGLHERLRVVRTKALKLFFLMFSQGTTDFKIKLGRAGATELSFILVMPPNERKRLTKLENKIFL